MREVKKLRMTVGAFIAVILLSATMTFAFLYLRIEQEQTRDHQIDQLAAFDRKLRQGLILSCERSDNPVRESVRRLLEVQIQQSQNYALLQEFFPQISLSKLEALVQEQNTQRRESIRSLRPLECQQLYPPTGTKEGAEK